ncbi:MAG: CPBP family glutamic-type intramembrane protease [Gemmataceae bacterium]
MNPTFETIGTYFIRVAPGFLLGAAMLFVFRREARLRIVFYLALFVLLRDAMTPLGLWSFGSQGFFWIRLAPDPLFMVLFGAGCLGLTLALYYLDRANRPLFCWVRGSPPVGLAWGLAGTLVAVAPLFVVYQYTPLEMRGGPVPTAHLAALLGFALLGNLLEEALFRGYVLGYLAQTMSSLKAGVASGLVFAFCHIFLATTVTSVGYPLLVFTLWEGAIAGLVGARSGVLPATLTHGGAIFLLASGLF